MTVPVLAREARLMPQARVRISVRSILSAAALVAVLLAAIRFVEQAINDQDNREWARGAASNEKFYRDKFADALRAGRSVDASRFEAEIDKYAKERQTHERQIGAFPHTFSRVSAFLVLVYVWAIALFLMMRAERSRADQTGHACPKARTDVPRLFIWFARGLIWPIGIFVAGVVFERRTGYTGSVPWPAYLVEGLLWLQIIYALLGVLVLGGRRWAAFGLGVVSSIATWWFALFSMMSVTGWWL